MVGRAPARDVDLRAHHEDLAEEVVDLRQWQARLAEGRWIGVTWPEEYGGRGAGALHHFIVQEELARARAPELVGRIGINLVGPTLLAHGTAEQKARWLPRILARRRAVVPALQRARRRHRPGRGVHQGRAGRRRLAPDRPEGLDQSTPSSPTGASAWPAPTPTPPSTGASPPSPSTCGPTGVEVRPLVQITGEAEFNEVFFDGVFVPDDHLIGAENDGWRVSSSTLTHERGTNPRQLVIHAQLLEELLRLAIESGALRRPPPAAAAGRGLRRGPPLPAPQLALAVPPRRRARSWAPRAARSSSTGAR